MIVETERLKKETFRSLVIALFVSFAYDTFWLLMSAAAYNRDDAGADGGMEKNIRHFALAMAIISFFFRVSSLRLY